MCDNIFKLHCTFILHFFTSSELESNNQSVLLEVWLFVNKQIGIKLYVLIMGKYGGMA